MRLGENMAASHEGSSAQEVAQCTATESIRPLRWRDPFHPDPWASRTKLMQRLISRDEAQLSMVRLSYFEGDPLADAMVLWMHETGMKQAWPIFELALTKGLQAVDDPHPTLKDFFRAIEHIPEWVKHEALVRGCDMGVRTSRMGELIAFSSLLGGYAAVGLAKPLVATRSLDEIAALRLVETTQWVYDVYNSRGLGRFSNGFISTVRVRVLHALVRNNLVSKGWDQERWGLPINQVDMGATLLGFSINLLIGLRLVGMFITPREGRDFMGLWRYVGYLIGVDDTFNPSTEIEAMKLIPLLIGSQEGPDDDSRSLAKSLLNTRFTRWPETQLGRISARCDINFRSALTRIISGRAAGDGLQLPNSVFWKAVVVLLPIFNVLSEISRILIPGGTTRSTERGRQRFTRQMIKISKGKRTNFGHRG